MKPNPADIPSQRITPAQMACTHKRSSTLAVDVGGTFTDLTVSYPETDELHVTKVLTTPGDLTQGVFAAFRRAAVDLEQVAYFKHGTTTAINTILEETGAPTALITTKGFRDVLEAGRGNRPEPFNLAARRRPPLVPRDLRFEISARMDGQGSVLRAVDTGELAEILTVLQQREIEAVAISLLHSYLNPDHEEQVAGWLRRNTDYYVSASHELSREWREYERTSTTVLSAYVGPRLSRYLDKMERRLKEAGFQGAFLIMESNGGVITIEEAKKRPIFLLESGPVAGVVGSAELAEKLRYTDVIAFDMGGTTAKCALIDAGRIETGSTYYVGGYERGYPVQVPVIDIVEIGAGGGSIASVDATGQLTVGPRSAGADPGPVCYGKGGIHPTVTDANLVLGRLGPEAALAGRSIRLERRTAEEQIAKRIAQPLGLSLEEAALGVLTLATVTMASAVRRVSIERGLDPRASTLVVTGGAGPLHGVDIARELGIPRVVVPPVPGNFSGWGMLLANIRYDFTRITGEPLLDLSAGEIEAMYTELETQAGKALADMGPYLREQRLSRHADMRFLGQEHTVLVPIDEPTSTANFAERVTVTFHRLYERRYGRSDLATGVEVVALRLSAEGVIDQPRLPVGDRSRSDHSESRADGATYWPDRGWVPTKTYDRSSCGAGERIDGPSVITEAGSTTVLGPNDSARVDEMGNLIIAVDLPLGWSKVMNHPRAESSQECFE